MACKEHGSPYGAACAKTLRRLASEAQAFNQRAHSFPSTVGTNGIVWVTYPTKSCFFHSSGGQRYDMKVLDRLLLTEALGEFIPYPVLISDSCKQSLMSLSW